METIPKERVVEFLPRMWEVLGSSSRARGGEEKMEWVFFLYLRRIGVDAEYIDWMTLSALFKSHSAVLGLDGRISMTGAWG